MLRAAAALFICLIAASADAQSTEPADRPSAGPLSSLSGYMELQFVNPSNADAFIDFRRFVLLFAHRFSDRLRFVSELEVEHAVVEGGEDKGELELEQAYLDFLIDRRFNIRAGQLLVPVGIINERHEPPTYYGVQRPFVDTVIIPTTWFDAGAGVFGEFGKGWRYRAYVMPPLNATEFSAGEGLADSSQQGSRSLVRHWAGTGRVEYLGCTAPHARREPLARTDDERIAAARSARDARRSRRTGAHRPPRGPRRDRARVHRPGG